MTLHAPEADLRGREDSGAAAASTIASLLTSSAVPMAALHERYGPLLELVRALIGVVPKCDEYLEIWPPAFRSYNILVPNFLNLPFSLFGLSKPSAKLVGLGLYVVSRVAECPYCTAHTCSFALRRGASAEKVAQALVGRGAPFEEAELAAIAVARALARVPCELQSAERVRLERCVGPSQAEWIVAGICMMGFLNKFMDAAGVELEASTAAEVRSTLGPTWSPGKAGRDLDPNAPAANPPATDSLWTKLRIVPLLPTAIRTDIRWQGDTPKTWPRVGSYLKERVGHDFPLLSRLRHKRLVQSIGSILRENLNPTTSVLGLETKLLAGAVFASVIGDTSLSKDIHALAQGRGMAAERLDEAARFATASNLAAPARDSTERAALLLARAASTSPAGIDSQLVETCRLAGLTPAALVELITWLSVLQMLHRWTGYFAVDGAPQA